MDLEKGFELLLGLFIHLMVLVCMKVSIKTTDKVVKGLELGLMDQNMMEFGRMRNFGKEQYI